MDDYHQRKSRPYRSASFLSFNIINPLSPGNKDVYSDPGNMTITITHTLNSSDVK